MLEQMQASRNTAVMGAPLGTLPLDWAELEIVSGRLDGLMARQSFAIGERYRELQHDIRAAESEREAIMDRIFGFVPALVGNA